jgi:hypothetical protein
MKNKILLAFMVVVSHLTANSQTPTLAAANLKKQNERFELASGEYNKLIQMSGGAMARQEEGAAQQLALCYYEKGDNYILWAQSEIDNDAVRKEKIDSATMMFDKGIKVMDDQALEQALNTG